MAYECSLSSGHKIYLDNQGTQTVVTSIYSNVGQQQQSSSSFSTGIWDSPPEIFNTSEGAIVKITSHQGEYFVQIKGSNISVMGKMPSINNLQQMQMQKVDSTPSSTMPPMQPMEPMKMGNMEMTMNPMDMRMGNMSMSMGSSSASTSTASTKKKRFCPQCGEAVNQSDRFCSSCGHNLNS